MLSFQTVERKLKLTKPKLREFIAWTIAINHFHNVTKVTKTLVIISCAH